MPADSPPVIDAAVHIYELDSDLALYFELPWQRALQAGEVPQSQRNASGTRLLDTPGEEPYTIYDPILGSLPPEPHRVTDPTILRADLDARGIDAAIMLTGRLLRAAASNDLPYVAALGRAYNRYLVERWLDPQRGLYGAIMAVNQAPEDAAKEIARYASHPGVAGVYLPLAGTYPLWGDASYDPIFAAAQEAGLPAVFQGATTIHTVFPYEFHHMPSALAKQALSQPFGALAHLAHMAVTGVFARFPRLQVLFNQVGVEWLALLYSRLDHFWPYLTEEAPFLAPRPSEVLRQHVHVTTHGFMSAHPRVLAAQIEAVGVGNVVFGTNWPHFDAGSPADVRRLGLPPADEQRILGGTAQALFRLLPLPVAR